MQDRGQLRAAAGLSTRTATARRHPEDRPASNRAPTAGTIAAIVNRLRATACLLSLSAPLLAGTPDPGLLLELDRTRFELVARDLREEARGPKLRVALGSPAHPTPSGVFPLYQVIRNPDWEPGPLARATGASREPASTRGPLGVAKIPFAGGGLALHGGAHPRLLGKPVSLGCVRTADADLLELLDWLEARGALGPARDRPGGETRQAFRRPTRLRIR